MFAELAESAAITSGSYAVNWYRTGHGLSPDGTYYLEMGRRKPVPLPYARRELIPRLLGDRVWAWKLLSGVALVATGPLVYLFTHSLSAVWLWAWLPWFSLNVRLPVLVDAAAMCMALAVAVLWSAGQWFPAIVLLLLLGSTRESGPIFAGAFASNPILCAGSLISLFHHPARKADQPWLEHPIRSARQMRDPLDCKRMLLPWGSVLYVVTIGPWTVQKAVALAIGYGQLLVAQDDSRLYQWAAPALLVGAHAPIWILAVHPFICAMHRGT